jgi:hypothetical protein
MKNRDKEKGSMNLENGTLFLRGRNKCITNSRYRRI